MTVRSTAGAWASLALSLLHGVLAAVAYGGSTPRTPIPDAFVRWELLDIEVCFTVLAATTSILAIRTGTSAPLVALAVLWTADAIFMVLSPMPLPSDVAWVRVPTIALLALLAAVCWRGAMTRPA
jgi:hypothetical protein